MIAYFQKLAAFFAAVAAFLSVLFGAGGEGFRLQRKRYGLPAFSAGIPQGTFESADGTLIARYEYTRTADFDRCVAGLVNAGFTVYDENRIEENRFATLHRDDTAVSVSRYERTGALRVIAGPKGEPCPLTDPYEARFDTLLTGMQGETVVANEGMGYILRLADGSFFIIDGGMGDPDHVDSDKLMGILLAQKPADAEKPVIAGWLFTHLHGDHIGVFNCFSLDHHDDVKLERLYYNFPKEEEIADSDSPYMLDDSIYRYTQFKKNLSAFYPDVPVVTLRSGDRFAVCNAAFEVLYAYDDLYPKTILDGGMNENSLLVKMTVEGQSVLWTGDLAFLATDLILSEYSDALKADFLQMAHHGWNGTKELYEAVDPVYALLPVSFPADLDRTLSSPQNAWLKNSPRLRQMIVTSYGTWTLRLPYDPAPGSYERIPSPGTVYPAYPALLGE